LWTILQDFDQLAMPLPKYGLSADQGTQLFKDATASVNCIAIF
jgi:hypothetical protein